MRRFVVLSAVAALGLVGLVGRPAFAADDTPEAAAQRELLKKTISVDYKDQRLEDLVDDLTEQVKGLHFRIDAKGGVSRNQTVTFSGKDVTVADALDKMFAKNGLGYVVESGKKNAYNGTITIKQGKERGYAAGDEPKEKEKVAPADKDKPKDKDK